MAPRVLIVGGGFAGLHAARTVAKGAVDVTVIDRQNHHLFQPLLYQVATAGLSPGDIASPIRNLLRDQPNVRVRLGHVTGIDLSRRRVTLDEGALDYDYLVLAAGVRHAYFGHDEWEADAPGLKTLDDALEIRRRVLSAFEAAELEADPEKRKAWLTFVVVGGGATGVELAGAICELARFTVAKDFRGFDPTTARVVLLEAGPRILTAFDELLAAHGKDSLLKLGVEVRTNTRVVGVDADGVRLESERLFARTVLWAAGVAGAPLARSLGVPLDAHGRVKVREDLSIPEHSEAFVVGDLACFEQGGHALPGLAPVAIQQGRHVGEVIRATIAGQPRAPFHYRDKGIMATVGRAAGLAQSGGLKVWGLLGWLMWLFVHLMYLVGFRNRVLVLIQWAWAWTTYGRGARLITGNTPVPPQRTGALATLGKLADKLRG